MNRFPRRRGSSIAGILATLALIIVIACGVIYAMGYAKVESTNDTTTIEVNTQQIKTDAGDAVESGKKLLNDAGKSIEEGAEEVQQNVSGESKPETEVKVETNPAPLSETN